MGKKTEIAPFMVGMIIRHLEKYPDHTIEISMTEDKKDLFVRCREHYCQYVVKGEKCETCKQTPCSPWADAHDGDFAKEIAEHGKTN